MRCGWRNIGRPPTRRVFKFCYESERLKALQREVALRLRLLKEDLGDRPDINRDPRLELRRARDLLVRHNGIEVDKTDGFLLYCDRLIEAVNFSLAYHKALDESVTGGRARWS